MLYDPKSHFMISWSIGPPIPLCLSQLTLEAFFRIFHNFELGNGDHLFKGHFTNSSLSVCLSVCPIFCEDANTCDLGPMTLL